ncbi:MAG: oxygen-independent coproporphyrinogen III oxidase [Bacteroidota bacterium]
MKISDKLLEKYNQPVPRYTSYPTANNFTDPVSQRQYMDMLRLSNDREPGNIAFYIHIPFCLKMCHYCGCNSCRLKSAGEYLEYHKALKKEIKAVKSHLDRKRPVTQVHFGGGTPNAIPAELLCEIVDMLRSDFDIAQDAEIAVECNPAILDRQYIDKLIDSGFNRFSLGIQDFNQDVLRMVNRDPSAIPVNELMEYMKKGNKDSAVNLDFIYGLPGQTPRSFEETISRAIAMRPDRLVTFSYAHVPWIKKNQKILEKYGLPSPGEKMDMFLRAYNLLKSKDYIPVGFDHYVLPEDELHIALKNTMLHRNFQGYCIRRTTGQVYAFGVSAISQLEPGYFQNVKSVEEYTGLLHDDILPVEKGRILNGDEKILRELIIQLMCNKYINWQNMSDILKIDIAKIQETVRIDQVALDDFSADGLLEYDRNQLRVTEMGSMFIRNIAVSLDPTYKPGKNKYSKSV